MGEGLGKNPYGTLCGTGCTENHLNGPHQPEVPYEHGCLGAQEICHCGTATALGRSVHYIVVKESGVVKQFRSSRKEDCIIVGLPQGLGHKDGQRRPYHLAGILPEGTVGSIKEPHIRTEGVFNDTLHPLQIRLYVTQILHFCHFLRVFTSGSDSNPAFQAIFA